MDYGQKIMKTFKAMASDRLVLEEHWKDAYLYTFPHRGQGFWLNGDPYSNASSAKDQQSRIYDSTGADSSRMLASSLQAGLTPSTQLWFYLSIPNVPDSQIPRSVRHWYQTTGETLHSMIHSSNYNAVGYEFFTDVTVGGMAGLYIEFDEIAGRFVFELWPLYTMYVADTQGLGQIDTVFRKVMMSAAELAAKFGVDALTDDQKKMFKEDPYSTKKYEIIHAIKPRQLRNGKLMQGKIAKTFPWASCWVCAKTGKLIYEGGYEEFPVIIPRWMIIPGTEYALGPVNDALPDIKTLNKEVEMVLSNAEMAIAGTFVAKHDGVINPNTVKIGPRRIVFAADTDNIKPLASGGNFQIANQEIQRLQFQIRRVMMSDQLEPTNQERTLSAEQVRTRTQLVRQFLGPVFGRLQSEFLNPLIKRCWGLAYRAGAFPPPPQQLINFPFPVPEYKSPLAKAQRMDDVTAMDRFEMTLIETAIKAQDPSILDVYDFDAASYKRADLLGLPIELILEEQEVKKKRMQRQMAAQQAVAAKAAAAMGPEQPEE